MKWTYRILAISLLILATSLLALAAVILTRGPQPAVPVTDPIPRLLAWIWT